MIDQNKVYTIVGVVIDTSRAVLYDKEANKITVEQGDPLIPFIRDVVVPAVHKHGEYIGGLTLTGKNIYEEYEKVSGMVKFFRVAKSKIASWFSDKQETQPVADVAVGVTDESVAAEEPVVTPEPVEDIHKIQEIIDNAVPASSPEFNHTDFVTKADMSISGDNNQGEGEHMHEEDTVVAVVGDKVIPNAEKLRNYITAATRYKDSAGIDAFMKRVAAVIDERGHSVEDLLTFLERADLPLANDGRIIVYKKVLKRGEGKYVDVHSKQVLQFLQSIVRTDITHVDPSRHNDCSYGLHVARRAYLSQFGGDTLLLCYVDPAHFIAVPKYTGNKSRVSEYEIAAELTDAQMDAVISGTPLSSVVGGAELLAKAIAGALPKPRTLILLKDRSGVEREYIKLNQADKVQTPVSEARTLSEEFSPEANKVTALEVEEALTETKPATVEEPVKEVQPEPQPEPVIVKPKAKPKAKTKAKPKAKSPAKEKPKTPKKRKGAYAELVDEILKDVTVETITDAQLKQLLEIKRTCKKGYAVLGIPEEYWPKLKAVK